MDKHDVESAINKICSETLPLEIDMTSFLLASCSHMYNVVAKTRNEMAVAKEHDLARNVRFLLEVVEITR